MAQGKYEVYRAGNYMILDRLAFPRIRIFVIYEDSEPVIDKITLIDKTPVSFFGSTIEEMQELGLLMTKEAEESSGSLTEDSSDVKTPKDWLSRYNKESALGTSSNR